MKITVTQEDIEQGRKGEPHACAVARAFFRAGVDHLGVMGPRVTVTNALGHLVSLLLPRSVWSWIVDFDAGRFVVPFSFDIGLRREEIRIRRNSANGSKRVLPMQETQLPRIIDLNRILESPSGGDAHRGVSDARTGREGAFLQPSRFQRG
jgi:hypothetical protein